MSNKQDYDKKIDVIMGISGDQIKLPSIPVDVFIQEAEYTHYWAEQDKEELLRVGLKHDTIDDLPLRAGACREAQSRWNMMRRKRRDAERKWKKNMPQVYDLRNRLLHFFRFAYRQEDHLYSRVSAIGKKQGHADMIQDLNDLAVLGRSDPAPLEAISFDKSLLDEAARVSDEMANLLAEVQGERSNADKAKIIRDKAYIHLKEAVDAIREYGKFVFWRDPEKLERYRCNYYRKAHHKNKRKNQKKEKNGQKDDSPEAK